MKSLILIMFLALSFYNWGQSKKEQIVELNEKTDSIQKANSLQSEIYKDSIFSLLIYWLHLRRRPLSF
jgi:hypothetical protein